LADLADLPNLADLIEILVFAYEFHFEAGENSRQPYIYQVVNKQTGEGNVE
jgi:hypothetical protein